MSTSYSTIYRGIGKEAVTYIVTPSTRNRVNESFRIPLHVLPSLYPSGTRVTCDDIASDFVQFPGFERFSRENAYDILLAMVGFGMVTILPGSSEVYIAAWNDCHAPLLYPGTGRFGASE